MDYMKMLQTNLEDYLEKYTDLDNYEIDVYNTDTLKISLGDGTVVNYSRGDKNISVILDPSTMRILSHETNFPRLQTYFIRISETFDVLEELEDSLIAVVDSMEEEE